MCANPKAMKSADSGGCAVRLSSTQQDPHFYVLFYFMVDGNKMLLKDDRKKWIQLPF